MIEALCDEYINRPTPPAVYTKWGSLGQVSWGGDVQHRVVVGGQAWLKLADVIFAQCSKCQGEQIQ